MNIAPVPATPLEAAVQDVRDAQVTFDRTNELYERLHIEISEARVRRDAASENLHRAQTDLFEVAVKTAPPITEPPIRVVPSYLTEGDVRLEEGVDAAWSEKGPDA